MKSYSNEKMDAAMQNTMAEIQNIKAQLIGILEENKTKIDETMDHARGWSAMFEKGST